MNITAPMLHDKIIVQSFIIILFLSICLFGFLDIKERLKATDLEKKYISQSEYVRNMETIVRIIHKEKHDLNNHLSTLIMLCQLRKEDTLEKVTEYSKKLLELPDISDYKHFNTGNTYMDGLLAVKHNIAAENSIHFEVDIEEQLNHAAIDPIDLTAILGNVLDNALDAHLLAPSKRPKPIVSLYSYFDLDTHTLNISVSNNGEPIPKENLKHIFAENFTTKGDHSKKERGFGLYISDQLIRKSKGSITVKSDETETEFLISLPVDRNASNYLSVS